MAKFCHECGKPVQSKWNLCPFCGSKLKVTESDETQSGLNILFNNKGYFCEGRPKGFTIAGNIKKGFILLSNNDLIFTQKRNGDFILQIAEIEKVEKFSRRGYTFINIDSKSGRSYTYWAANMILGQYLGGKTNKLYTLLVQIVRRRINTFNSPS